MKERDYIRTKNGIAKITKIDLNVNACEIDKQLNDFHFVLNENIIKSSPNIIDLIEVGDYVNGNVVKELNNELLIMNTGLIYDNLYIPIKKIEIRSIVTKEQFESMEYKIGE